MAPTILPPMMRGRPPSTGTAPCSARKRTPAPPAARMSCIALVGRLNRTEDRALSCAMLTLATCVPSIFSKYTRSPAMSTIAIAIFQLFLLASATDNAAIFFASAALIDAPYGFGICANAGAEASTTSAANASFFISHLYGECGHLAPGHAAIDHSAPGVPAAGRGAL